jgi:hypothetical protein
VTAPASALGILEPAFGFGATALADPAPGPGGTGHVTGGLSGGWPVTGGLASRRPPPWVPPRVTEEDIFRDIRDRLDATGVFAQVILNAALERGAEHWPRALVQDPLSHTETWSGTGLRWRLVPFWVTISHRESESNARYSGIKWLERIARDALDGQRLAGVTLPAWTQILRAETPPQRRMGRWTAPRPLEQELRLIGQFAYEIDDRSPRAGTEPD